MRCAKSPICRRVNCSIGATSACSRTAATATRQPVEATASAGPRVAVAYSGGRDSTALLHATLQVAAPLGLDVVALHVHHGLSPRADAWLAHAESACQRWARRGHRVVFASQRIEGSPGRGESVEAWARKHRYSALRAMALAHGATLVLLAHHRRDQAETFLLQALRGSGLAGLAGMPRQVERDGLVWARPWLDQPRERIEAYARRYRLAYIDDESNDDERYARNRMRGRVWPTLQEAFPQSEQVLAEAAGWAQEANACLAELASLDLARVVVKDRFELEAWLELSGPRRSNALRAWLRGQIGRPATAALVTRLMAELPVCRGGRWLLEAGQLRMYRGALTYTARPLEVSDARSVRETTLRLSRAGAYALPGWGGTLRATRAKEGGLAIAWLDAVVLAERCGAERFQAGPGRPPRSLKKQFQAAGVPSHAREGPLLYGSGRLLFVSGLGIDARAVAAPGEPQLRLEWVPAAPIGAAAASRGRRHADR